MASTSDSCRTLSRTEVFAVAAVAAAVMPFFLLYLEQKWLPYPELIEELAKAIVVLLILFHVEGTRNRLILGCAFAFLFSLTENIIYGLNHAAVQAVAYFLERTLYVTPMHMATVAVMVISSRKSAWLLPLGTAAAVAVHVIYNYCVGVL